MAPYPPHAIFFLPFGKNREPALTASPNPNLNPGHSSRDLLARLITGHIRPHFLRLGLAILFMILAAGATAANAWLMEPVLDDVFLKRDAAMLALVPLAVLSVAFIKGASEYGRTVLMSFIGQRIISDLQREMFSHLMKADMAFYHNNPAGTLISRFTNDVGLLRGAVSTVFTGVIKDFLTVIFLVALMFYQNWQMALIAFFVFPAAIYPIIRIGKRMRKVSTHTQQEVGQFTTLLNQSFQGARHIKAYGMEHYEMSRAGDLIEKIFSLLYKAARVSSLTRPVMETLGGVAIAAVIFYGGSQVISGQTTPGTFFSFITALLLAYQPLKGLANLNTQLQTGLAAAARIFSLLDLEPEIADAPNAQPLTITKGGIRFDEVSFSYGGDVSALNRLSLNVEGGQNVALVGPSGAGKSTILNLIPRFYDIGAGMITVDGQDVRSITLSSLRSRIALVSQEVTLFDDTVRANIAYGRMSAGEDEIIHAAKKAAAHDFISALPQGYETIVGEGGLRLSGGQRQRIAIARAILKNAPLLLLDEATSALDSESEQQIQAALSELMEGRTTLVIAHRLSTVQHADVIYVMEKGQIVERGSHEELLATGNLYARLYEMQFAGQQGKDARSADQVPGGSALPVQA